MKKVFSLALAALFFVSLISCGSKKADDYSDEKSEVVGGWREAEDGTVTEEHLAMFEKALDGYTGATFTPKKLIATQVVAGTNYKFLCDQNIFGETIIKSEKYVTVYRDLEGNCTITDVQDVAD